jgi:outer membrane murein-binding lipoprotein Lpp
MDKLIDRVRRVLGIESLRWEIDASRAEIRAAQYEAQRRDRITVTAVEQTIVSEEIGRFQ